MKKVFYSNLLFLLTKQVMGFGGNFLLPFRSQFLSLKIVLSFLFLFLFVFCLFGFFLVGFVCLFVCLFFEIAQAGLKL